MYRIVFYLAAYKRPEITEICFKGLKRLINYKPEKFRCSVVVVYSTDEVGALVKKYKFDGVKYKNDPLGEKKNFGLQHVMKKPFDYLIELGSDDLIKNDLLDLYEPYFEKGVDYFGIQGVYFINSETGETRKYTEKTMYGLGRCMSKKLLEDVAAGVEVIANEPLLTNGQPLKVGDKGFMSLNSAKQLQAAGIAKIVSNPTHQLWMSSINQGLDNNSNYFIMSRGYTYVTVTTSDENPLTIDIKSEQNIWKFNPDIGTPADLSEALDGLSQEERNALFRLLKNKAKKIEYSASI